MFGGETRGGCEYKCVYECECVRSEEKREGLREEEEVRRRSSQQSDGSDT